MKIAVFGGTFDPPTVGHMGVIAYCLQSNFDQVWVVPSKKGWFKPKRADFYSRCHMLTAAILEAFGSDPRVQVIPIESELPKERVPLIDLWCELLRRYPEHQFTLVVGEDVWKNMPSWEGGELLATKVPVLVVPRQPDGRISSTWARRLIHENLPTNAILPGSVSEMIHQNGWYRHD